MAFLTQQAWLTNELRKACAERHSTFNPDRFQTVDPPGQAVIRAIDRSTCAPLKMQLSVFYAIEGSIIPAQASAIDHQ
jgi:hypothetical protein